MRYKASKQVICLFHTIMKHVEKAHEELERMNVGNCHDELNHIRSFKIELEDEQGEID